MTYVCSGGKHKRAVNLYHTVSSEVVQHVQGALAKNINTVLGAAATCNVPFYKSSPSTMMRSHLNILHFESGSDRKRRQGGAQHASQQEGWGTNSDPGSPKISVNRQ